VGNECHTMASLSNDDDHNDHSASPRVLSQNIIPTITKGLDASDVLECYALVRTVPLHGMANATLHIQKAALGFRYRPAGGKGTPMIKKPIEITLEYGPQRVGTMLAHDAMPLVQVEETSAFISWDNVGRVYYTTNIVSENYLSSYYMGSMTGTVLGKMLGKAVEYSENRRRYQPFAVYSGENEKMLRSSSSQDFTSYIWKELASLGVEIEPILSPPIYEARLWASSVDKIIPEGQVANDAALFYSKLYQCLTAIATNDYTGFMPTAQPSISASPTFSPNESNSSNATATSESNSTESNNGEDLKPQEDITQNDDDDAETGGDDDTDRRYQVRRRLEDEEKTTDDVDDYVGDDYVDDAYIDGDFYQNDLNSEADESGADDIGVHSEIPTNTPSFSPAPTTSMEPSLEQGNADGDAEMAEQAADEAIKAADEAKNAAETEEENKAADAAQAAADAAKKAADSSTKAAAQAAMDALLSGDGDAMTSIITANCLANPEYGIATLDEDGNLTSHAYLYRDGSLYWHLDLVPPYFTVEKINRPLPKAADLSNFGDGGDFVDWTLAFLVLGMILVGIVMIVQQMNIKFFDRLYNFQRWFFNPTNHDYEGDMLVVTDSVEVGEDGVPISMGGRRTLTVSYRDVSSNRDGPTIPSESSNSSSDHDHAVGDVELCEFSGSRVMPPRSTDSSISRNGSVSPLDSNRSRNSSFDDEDHGKASFSKRLNRSRSSSFDDEDHSKPSFSKHLMKNPDLVDLPSLSSTSKVAMPVGVPKNGNTKTKGNDWLDEGS
jgi:hypothetical protein